MPTYSYQCKRCNHIHDVFHTMSAAPVVKCDQCGGRCIKLLGTGAGIIFKGSGFYETDYKNKGKKPASETTKSESKGTTEKSSPSSSGADKKPPATASAG